VKSAIGRHIAFAVMILVTAWSVWAWAQPAKPRPGSHAVDEKSATAPERKAEEAEGEGPPPMNWTTFGAETPPFVAMLINFGILAAGYYLLGRKPIAAGLQARRDNIAKDIEEAQRMKSEAEARAKIYQGKLETLEGELRSARDSLVHAGEAESERIVRDVEAKADRMRKDAVFLVEQELKQLRDQLWRETVEAAVLAAEDLLKKRVAPADQERLAEDYLTDLGTRPRAASAEAPRVSSRPIEPGPGSAS
jgi:F0F1-type ATP synthase membrane subunit b/b'